MLPLEVGILQLVAVEGSGDVDVFRSDADDVPDSHRTPPAHFM